MVKTAYVFGLFALAIACSKTDTAPAAVVSAAAPVSVAVPSAVPEAVDDGTTAAQFAAKMKPTLAEIRQHAANGRSRKHEMSPACMNDFRPRLERVQSMRKEIIPPTARYFDDQAADIANAYDDVTTSLMRCIDCAPADQADCAEVDTRLAKLTALIAKVPTK